jgi:hypothetical protein
MTGLARLGRAALMHMVGSFSSRPRPPHEGRGVPPVSTADGLEARCGWPAPGYRARFRSRPRFGWLWPAPKPQHPPAPGADSPAGRRPVRLN